MCTRPMSRSLHLNLIRLSSSRRSICRRSSVPGGTHSPAWPNSSKAQMGFIVIAAALVLYLTDQITADVVMKVLLAVAGLYAGSTAIEDASVNLGGEK